MTFLLQVDYLAYTARLLVYIREMQEVILIGNKEYVAKVTFEIKLLSRS